MIPVTSSLEFAKLVNALSDDVVYANIHWRLRCDLIDALKEQPAVRYQSPTFWHLTIEAHAGTALESLCRAFDQQQASLHLLSWLRTIQENFHFFGVSEFKDRLAGNAFVDSLAAQLEPPDVATLEADIHECTAKDPLVRKLMALRNSAVAHRSPSLALTGNALPDLVTLTVEDVDTLMARARKILNRYSQLFSAETHSVNMVGREDFEYIFKSVAASVARWDSETEG